MLVLLHLDPLRLVGGRESRSLLQKQQHPQVNVEKRPIKTQRRAGTKKMKVIVFSYDNIIDIIILDHN